jgi:hypothetical protein
MIRLACSFVASIGRHQLEDYVRELEVDVFAFDESGHEVLVGRIAATQVLWADAEMDGESLFDICDNDSQGLYEVYRTLTDKQGMIRTDLNADEVVDHVILVYRIVLHPDLEFCRRAILESVVTLFGCESLAVMWKETGSFWESELADLGFCKIAGEELIFRHSGFKTPFSKTHPRGLDVDFEARPEHAAWVAEHWAEEEKEQQSSMELGQ